MKNLVSSSKRFSRRNFNEFITNRRKHEPEINEDKQVITWIKRKQNCPALSSHRPPYWKSKQHSQLISFDFYDCYHAIIVISISSRSSLFSLITFFDDENLQLLSLLLLFLLFFQVFKESNERPAVEWIKIFFFKIFVRRIHTLDETLKSQQQQQTSRRIRRFPWKTCK